MRVGAWLLVMSLIFPAVSLAQQPEGEKPLTIEDWLVGKPREEVVRLLGEPSKTKLRKGATVLVYKPDPGAIAFFPSDTPNPYAFVAEGDPGSGAIDTLLDVFVNPGTAKEYTGLDHAVQVGKKSAVRRVEFRLDSRNRVETVHVAWRKRPKRPRDATHE